MMGTRRESKFFTIFVMILILLMGCSNATKTLVNEDLTEDSFREIKAGMTSKKAKSLLGEPDEIFDSEEEVQEKMIEDSNVSTDKWSSEDPDIYDKFYGGEKNKKRYYKLLDERQNEIICYEYAFDNTRTIDIKWHIYFLDDKVVDMYFP